MAMQLRQIAAPGTILLSVATQHLVQEDVWMEPQGEVTVGATRAPVPVYGVRGIAQRRSGGVGHGARARSPFVGRERELALLHERLDVVMAGQGQVVAIVAEPGMGKPQLLKEYRRSLVGRQVRYGEGHCLSYGSAVSYICQWWTWCVSAAGSCRRVARRDYCQSPPTSARGRHRSAYRLSRDTSPHKPPGGGNPTGRAGPGALPRAEATE